jgi:raffinose/stachyose/melibiose transport system permease protein
MNAWRLRAMLAGGGRYVALLVFLAVAAYPLLWMFLTAFRTRVEVSADKWALPTSLSLENFSAVLATSFPWYILNSLIAVGASVVLTLGAAAPAGFVFSRMRFRGGAALFFLFLVGMMIPVHILLIPLVKVFQAIGLSGTLTSLVLTYVGFSLPLSVFVLKGFFDGVPMELEEAARIDGASDFQFFWRVCVPLARPAIAVVVIFNFITLWNEFVFALVLIHEPDLRTVPLGMFNFAEENGPNVPLTCAALCISVLPMLLVYFLAQKHIIRGLTSGAVKG